MLEELLLKNESVEVISKKLQRSTNAIRLMFNKKGLRSKYPDADLHTDVRNHIKPKGYANYVKWRQHPRYKNYYCSSTGLVWSARSGVELSRYYLNSDKGNKKGLWVSITRNGRPGHQTKVSRLIAEAWLKEFKESLSVLHIDGNRDNNDIANLKLLTKSELGRRTGHLSSSIPIARYNKEGKIIKVYRSVRSAAKDVGVSYQTVLDKANGKLKRPTSCKGIDLRYYKPVQRIEKQNADLSYRSFDDVDFTSVDNLKEKLISADHVEFLIDRYIERAEKAKTFSEEKAIDNKLDVLMQYYAMF